MRHGMTEIVMVSRGDAKTRNLCPKGNGSLSAILPTVHAPWSKVKLGEVLRLFHGKAIRSSSTGNCPVYGSNGVIGKCDTSLYDNAIIIGRVGAYCGSVAREKGLFWASDNTIVCKAVDDVADTDFCYYLLEVLHLNNYSGGTAQPLITQGIIKQIEVSLPPLPVQQRIADILSSYDDLIENNRRRIAILEETARLTYQKWFDGTDQTRTATLGSICQTFGGGTPKTGVPEFWDGDIPWVVPTDITRNTSLALLDTERKITVLGLQKSSAKMLPANTILMTSRASVGYFGIADFPVCTNQGFISIIPNNDSWRWYLLFNLMSRVEEIRSNAKGSTFPEISRARFRSMEIIVPNDDVLIEFNVSIEPLMQQVRTLAKQNKTLASIRDMLLPRLMKEIRN